MIFMGITSFYPSYVSKDNFVGWVERSETHQD